MKLYKSAQYIGSRESFFNTSLFKICVFEMIIAIVHPNYYFHGIKYTTDKIWNLLEIEYEINDFIILILLVRVFYFFRVIIVLTKFFGDRADRVT
jgi:hypothetical protein